MTKLRIRQTGEEHDLQFKEEVNFDREDRTQVHQIPFRQGDIEQKVGSGNQQITGTLVILPDLHPGGIEGYKEFLRDAARTDGYVVYIDEDGNEIKGSIREPDFKRNLTEYPNKEELQSFKFVDLNQPQP